MANDKDGLGTPDEIAALTARITAMEQLLAAKIPGFEQVGTRVAELSTAFQKANERLAGLESAVTVIQEAPAVDLSTLTNAVGELTTRVAAIETVRLRGGTLSRRLADIEARLPEPTNGGATE